MATSNFYNKDASKIFVCLESYEDFILDEDGNETEEKETRQPERYEINEFIEDVKEQLEELGNYYMSETSGKYNRNFSETSLGTIYKSKNFAGVEVNVYVNCCLISGYYEAANLDYSVSFDVGNYTEMDETDLNDLEQDMYDMIQNYGMAKIQAKNVLKWLNKATIELTDLVEEVYTKNSNQYQLMARFSNGETMYQKI